MTQHILQGRTEAEVLWFRRRSFLQAAAAWTAMGCYEGAMAQQRGNIVELVGEATVNGERLRRESIIQSGDSIETGRNSGLVFVMGNSSFLVRPNSRITVERGATLSAVSVLRMLTGAVVSVWGRGNTRQIQTPTLTAGIRGTGVYTEIYPERNNRTYFCNCYGVVEIGAGNQKVESRADYHQSFWAEPEPVNGRMLTPAGAINHTDEEVEALARLMGQRTAWQIAGRKGVKDGRGYMEQQPPTMHPAMPR
ncbi:MAG: iron dicitrate transport regulator FecR [Burkholderiales bacterium]|nr:iron dicitrate transport regulator FecR [Burkholderiales bacterium]